MKTWTIGKRLAGQQTNLMTNTKMMRTMKSLVHKRENYRSIRKRSTRFGDNGCRRRSEINHHLYQVVRRINVQVRAHPVSCSITVLQSQKLVAVVVVAMTKIYH